MWPFFGASASAHMNDGIMGTRLITSLVRGPVGRRTVVGLGMSRIKHNNHNQRLIEALAIRTEPVLRVFVFSTRGATN